MTFKENDIVRANGRTAIVKECICSATALYIVHIIFNGQMTVAHVLGSSMTLYNNN